ncbi:hypothetical protein [Pedobacter chitinilyticus]|uniref:Uncharacterized protein n=1 Tax=Pedobacter chitinilyticus TaxID=2233776 RepID=A0A443Z2M1_9SPHI|nr:hypothetical protein [Pedobacter chitinilyticus]RWU10761.1 hypothetical protein DPV69_05375 [Pedobacter chitinilyticus]
MKSKINVPTISVNDAVDRVTRFRDQLAKQVPETNIPRAVFIPISDLLAIINSYDILRADGTTINELQGVRAYFAVKEDDMNLDDDITAVIVPVDKDGADIIYKTPGNGGLGDDDDDTEIYDFTQPCPDKCDPKSPLFVP